MGSAWGCFPPVPIALCLLLGFRPAGTEPFQVLAPAGPLSAQLGGSVVLPCQLSPALSAQAMGVTWSRPRQGQDVHVYRPDGREEQGAAYRGRTELLTQGLAHGNISLRLRAVGPRDAGQYRCEVRSPEHNAAALLELSVTGSGADPVLHIPGYEDGGVRVLCLSAGWYPEPHVLWSNSRGEPLSPTSEEKPHSADGLFNVSSSVVLAERSDPTLTCLIRAGASGAQAETTVRITGLFPRQDPQKTASILLLVTFLLLLVLAPGLRWKIRAVQGEASKEHEWKKFLDKVALSPADVTLDQSSANPFLVLSESGRRVACGVFWQDVPKSYCRFDSLPGVLASQSFAAGQHYWEVEVDPGGDWAIGVARASVERLGVFKPSSDVGVWALQCQEGKWSALTYPATPLQLPSAPGVVRLHLDCERGRLAFYDTKSMAHIFTFTGCPRESLFPFFLLSTSGTQLTILPPSRSQAKAADGPTRAGTRTQRKRQGSVVELLIQPAKS